MLKISKILLVALAGFSITAQADLKTAEIRLGETVRLTNCGGTATLVKYSDKLVLSVRGTSCANARTQVSDYKLDGSGNQDRFIDITIAQDKGTRRVLIGSNEFIKTDGANPNSLGDMLYVIPPVAAVDTLPNNWSYSYAYINDYSFDVGCFLIDSAGRAVMEMRSSVCASGTRNVPSDTFYSYQSGTNQCFLWKNRYEKVSENAVKQEKCER